MTQNEKQQPSIFNRQTFGNITNSGIFINHIGNGDTYTINELRKLFEIVAELKAEIADLARALQDK